MVLSEQEKEQRKKAIIVLIARWAKSNDTKKKAQLLMEKTQYKKTRRLNA